MNDRDLSDIRHHGCNVISLITLIDPGRKILNGVQTPALNTYGCKAGKPAYNLQPKGDPMTIRTCAVLCFAAAISVTMAAQSEPVLVSANIPKHPPLACQA